MSLRVVIAGAGYFSRFHHRAWARMEDVSLRATCDRDLAKARAMARPFAATAFDDVAAMLDDVRPDLLDIAAPPPTHLALIAAPATAA